MDWVAGLCTLGLLLGLKLFAEGAEKLDNWALKRKKPPPEAGSDGGFSV